MADLKNKVFVLSGPTASFKSSGAIKLALKLKELGLAKVEIVNFDSLLFYKELNIGTAKPKADELKSVPHHLIDIETIAQPLNASKFKILAEICINEIHLRKSIPILVGGSGFYLRALLKGMYPIEMSEENHRKDTSKLKYSEVREKLQVVDNESFNKLHENDEYRNRRALEYFELSGKKISEEKAKLTAPYNFSSDLAHDWKVFHLHFDIPKTEHWNLILERTGKMLEQGLIKEVQELKNRGFTGFEKPLQSIGYKEAQFYLEKKIKNEAELLEAISISTRQLAKSQRTFFKRSLDKLSFHPLLDWEKIETQVIKFLIEDSGDSNEH